MSTYDLADKVVLITGGTGGLGRATAQGLLARGANVAVVDVHARTPDLAADLSRARALGVTADVTDRSAMDAAAAATVARFGRIDVAIANAGVMGAASTLRTMPAASAEQVLTVNVNGVLNTVGATIEQVIAHQGQIVLVSSVFAFMNGMGAIPYAMSKAAVEQLGRGLRIELAEHGASVLTAYFSLIQTDMIRKGVDADPRVLEILAALPGRFRSGSSRAQPLTPSSAGWRDAPRGSSDLADGRLSRWPGECSAPRRMPACYGTAPPSPASASSTRTTVPSSLSKEPTHDLSPRTPDPPNGQVLPNRIMKSALSEPLPTSECPDHRLAQLYRTWSRGGYGLVITGNVMVDRTQLGEPGNVVIEDERDLEALTHWAAATLDAGIPTWVQLNHPGRQSNLLALGHVPVAPSAVPLSLPGAATPRELTSTEIEDIIERFATAAAVCEKAGFAGVQVHGAHGYLVSQFLSPLTNKRTDDWGGDPERRMRFVLEVVRRIRARVSPGFAVGIKLNSADFQRGGFTEEESRAVRAALAKEGIDLIEVTGGFRSGTAMDSAVAAGECDVVGIGRPTATTPDAADAILSGRSDSVVAHQQQYGMRRLLGRVADLKTLDGVLELGWHADQLHRLGAGLEPDLGRGQLATTVSMLRRNGRTALRGKRRS